MPSRGARIFVFPTGPGLIVPQLQREIQNDIVVTGIAILDRAREAGIIAALPGGPRWRNPLVIAGSGAVGGTFAAPDPTPACEIDGPALLAKLGLRPARVLGTVDTNEVAFLLASGAAQTGFLYKTDVRANPSLRIIRPVGADIQPSPVYAASVTRLARRPDPAGFVAFLASPEATALLSASGLERQA